jgi:hypothetical protein
VDFAVIRDNPTIALGPLFRYQRTRTIPEGIPAMADHTPTGPAELGAPMDYQEHEKTYSLFIALVKYGSLVCCAILVAMAFGFFTSAGFFSAAFLFILLTIVGGYLLR